MADALLDGGLRHGAGHAHRHTLVVDGSELDGSGEAHAPRLLGEPVSAELLGVVHGGGGEALAARLARRAGDRVGGRGRRAGAARLLGLVQPVRAAEGLLLVLLH